jgi:hypothetical protein
MMDDSSGKEEIPESRAARRPLVCVCHARALSTPVAHVPGMLARSALSRFAITARSASAESARAAALWDQEQTAAGTTYGANWGGVNAYYDPAHLDVLTQAGTTRPFAILAWAGADLGRPGYPVTVTPSGTLPTSTAAPGVPVATVTGTTLLTLVSTTQAVVPSGLNPTA